MTQPDLDDLIQAHRDGVRLTSDQRGRVRMRVLSRIAAGVAASTVAGSSRRLESGSSSRPARALRIARPARRTSKLRRSRVLPSSLPRTRIAGTITAASWSMSRLRRWIKERGNCRRAFIVVRLRINPR